MNRIILVALASSFALSGCSDIRVAATPNHPPVLQVVSPASGQVVAAGADLTLVGFASDAETPDDQLLVNVSSDADGAISIQSTILDGELAALLPGGLSAGEHTLTVEVIDDDAGSATQELSLTAVPNGPPEVVILDPAPGALFDPSHPLELAVRLQDDFDPVEELLVNVSSDVDGALTAEATFYGNLAFLRVTETLSPADHDISVRAFDTGGSVGQDVVELAARTNAPPEIVSLTPADGWGTGDTPFVRVDLAVTDDTDDLTQLQLTWSGLPDAAPCGACTWPSAPESDGTFGFYLDLATCSDQNRSTWFVLGLEVTDPEGLSVSVEHQVSLECDP